MSGDMVEYVSRVDFEGFVGSKMSEAGLIRNGGPGWDAIVELYEDITENVRGGYLTEYDDDALRNMVSKWVEKLESRSGGPSVAVIAADMEAQRAAHPDELIPTVDPDKLACQLLDVAGWAFVEEAVSDGEWGPGEFVMPEPVGPGEVAKRERMRRILTAAGVESPTPVYADRDPVPFVVGKPSPAYRFLSGLVDTITDCDPDANREDAMRIVRSEYEALSTWEKFVLATDMQVWIYDSWPTANAADDVDGSTAYVVNQFAEKALDELGW